MPNSTLATQPVACLRSESSMRLGAVVVGLRGRGAGSAGAVPRPYGLAPANRNTRSPVGRR